MTQTPTDVWLDRIIDDAFKAVVVDLRKVSRDPVLREGMAALHSGGICTEPSTRLGVLERLFVLHPVTVRTPRGAIFTAWCDVYHAHALGASA